MHPAIVEGLLIHQRYVLNGENVRLRPLLRMLIRVLKKVFLLHLIRMIKNIDGDTDTVR